MECSSTFSIFPIEASKGCLCFEQEVPLFPSLYMIFKNVLSCILHNAHIEGLVSSFGVE